MCKTIHEHSVHGKEKIHLVNKFVNVKNVYKGHVKDLGMVYKKLAHDSELEKLDDLICEGRLSECPQHGDRKKEPCRPPVKQPECKFHAVINNMMIKLAGPLTVAEVLRLAEATACPSQRLINRFVDRYQERGDFMHQHGLSPEEKMMFLYTLSVNQEPIILQTFPSGEGWPFPHYIGACGRLIAEEDSGKPLRMYVNSHWKTRLALSLQLLRIAEFLSDNASAFLLYFNDISLDNYVVSESGKVVIADAENIVVVDGLQVMSDKPNGWNEPHVADYDECPPHSNCLTIDVETLCAKTSSDFNYYAVCKGLLSEESQDEGGDMVGGLLHSLPVNLPEGKMIQELANQCARPTEGKSRVDIVHKLTAALEQSIKWAKKYG